MLLRCIRAENKKLKHSIIFFACILIPVIPAIMGGFNYVQNTGILTQKWYSLWTQVTLFYANFFYAPLIALYCSYLWRMDHLHNNWNVLMTAPVSVSSVYFGKLAIILKITLFTQIWIGILYLITGKLVGFSGFPPFEILIWLLRGTLAAIAIGALQLLLSMIIRSFSIPIGIALLGSIVGFLFINKGLGYFCPYALMLMGMNSNKTEDSLQGGVLPFLLSTVVFFLLFSGCSIYILKKRDVRA